MSALSFRSGVSLLRPSCVHLLQMALRLSVIIYRKRCV